MSKYENLPCNGQDGQPCEFGCLLVRNKETNKLFLQGDCRCPWNSKCALNIQDEEEEMKKATDN
jgi:hypothetical protein